MLCSGGLGGRGGARAGQESLRPYSAAQLSSSMSCLHQLQRSRGEEGFKRDSAAGWRYSSNPKTQARWAQPRVVCACCGCSS